MIVVPDAVTEAFRQMRTGRPRPVYIDMPPEVAVEREEIELRNPAPVSRIVPSPEDLREAARVIAQAQLPIIFAGGGVALSDAEQALVRLAEATNIPVITSGGGKGAIPDSHPLCYGSCLSPAGERHETNQLLRSDAVRRRGDRSWYAFFVGKSGWRVEHADKHQHRGQRTYKSAVQDNPPARRRQSDHRSPASLPHSGAGAGERPSPVDAVIAARRLIAYYDISAQGAPIPYPGGNQEQHP